MQQQQQYTSYLTMSEANIHLPTLLQTLCKLSLQSCQIMQISQKKKCNKKYKSFSDPVTETDHTIQKLISMNLNKHFPSIQIIGEQYIDEQMIDHNVLENVLSTQLIFGKSGNQSQRDTDKVRQFNQSLFYFQSGIIRDYLQGACDQDFCVFVDPLDCTRGWVSGSRWECTVLIGLTYKGIPIFGIIGQPFKRINQQQYFYYPRLLIGGTIFTTPSYLEFSNNQLHKHCTINSKKMENSITNVSVSLSSPSIAVSSRRTSKTQEVILQNLAATSIHCGGSGNKLAMLIRGQIQAVLFVECALSSWDCCAGQAIVMGMKGLFSRPDGSKLSYGTQKESQTNEEGYICSLEMQLHSKIVTIFCERKTNN